MAPLSSAPPRGKFSKSAVRAGAIGAAIVIVAGAGGAKLLAAGPPKTAGPPPAQVEVALPLQATIAEWDDYVGRFEASQAVDIRPRVAGALVGVYFKDGQTVQKGQLLFAVDPRPYQAALAQANARTAEARTALTLAKADLARASRLIQSQAVAAEEVDSLKAKVETAAAGLAGAEADARVRALDVEFTQVRSPITGKVSDRKVDVGNLVAAGQGAAATLLTTVYAVDPIYFRFDGSEALYLKAQRDRSAGPVQAQIRLQDETDYRWNGVVDFTDNAIDPGAGTMRSRAVIRNPGAFLTPGMFGNMRLGTGRPVQALLVPDSAIAPDQARKTVLVVGKDGAVAVRPVILGPLVQGLRVVRQGLGPQDRVVIQGGQGAAPGAKVAAKPGRILAVADPADSAATATPSASQATLVAAAR